MTSATFGYHQLPNGYWIKDSDNSGPYVQSAPGVFGLAGQGLTAAQLAATQSLVSGARILASGADVAGSRTVTGTTSEVSLALVTVPADAMGTNGAIRISGWCSHTNGASLKTLRVKFGAMVLTHAPTTNVSEQWTLWIRNVATNAQRAHASIASSQGATGSAVVTGSVDTTTAVQLGITGQLAVGADFLTLEGFCVELLP